MKIQLYEKLVWLVYVYVCMYMVQFILVVWLYMIVNKYEGLCGSSFI